jgi:hypothetical protein
LKGRILANFLLINLYISLHFMLTIGSEIRVNKFQYRNVILKKKNVFNPLHCVDTCNCTKYRSQTCILKTFEQNYLRMRS